MDHSEAIRLMAAEKYLLGELKDEARDQFEEHFFECQECAQDVRAGTAFVEHSKVVLADSAKSVPQVLPVQVAAKHSRGWPAWLSPAFAASALAVLLAILTYQNLVTYPQLKLASSSPQILPWASINVSTRGTSATQISPHRGEGFQVLLNIAPDNRYTSYSFDLLSPSGKLKWSRTVPALASEEARSIYIPGINQEQGVYTLAVRGGTADNRLLDLGHYSIEVQIQK